MHVTTWFTRRLIVLVLLVVSVGSFLAFSRDRAPRRDVFLIVLDTVRRDSLGCYGYPGDPTPNLDALAADGARFDRVIATTGWTLPSVASVLTATWPAIHGAGGRLGSLTRIRAQVPTGPEILRAHGFRTAGFINSPLVSGEFGVDRGFEVFDARYDNNLTLRRADETIDAALGHLDRTGSRSDFFLLHLFDAHLDYDPPREHLARFVSDWATPRPPLSIRECRALLEAEGSGPAEREHVRGVYQGEVSFMDAEIGRLVRTLKEQGRYEEATIVVVSDHGEEFLDHGGFEHGHTLYEELIRVALIVKLPRALGVRGSVIETQVRTLDVMPTILDLCDVPAPATFDGSSLLSMILGNDPTPRFAMAEGTLYGPQRVSVCDGRHKLIRTARPGSPDALELYDLIEDPGEQKNLVRLHPDVAQGLSRKLAAFRLSVREANDSLHRPEKANLDPAELERLRSLGYMR